MTDENRTVKIGGETYVIQRFRGLKAILAMAALTRIAREVPDILADATKEYQRRNTIIVTEAMSKLPRWEGFSKADFDEAEALNEGRREIELPSPITPREQVMAALPALLEGARKEVIRLFAILVIPNEELMEADKADRVNEALDKYRDVFLYEAEIGDLVEVSLAAQASLSEQLTDDQRKQVWELTRSLVTLINPTMGQLQSTQAPTTEAESIPVTSPPDVQMSFTDSPTPTDGQESKSSLTSPGVS
jgi:hypothetical protein